MPDSESARPLCSALQADTRHVPKQWLLCLLLYFILFSECALKVLQRLEANGLSSYNKSRI